MSNSAVAWMIAIVAAIAAATGIFFWQEASTQASNLQEQVDQLSSERLSLRSEVRGLESDATLTAQRLRSLESQLERTQASDSEQINTLTEQSERLQAQLSASQRSAQQAADALANAQNDWQAQQTALEAQVADNEAALAAAITRADAAEAAKAEAEELVAQAANVAGNNNTDSSAQDELQRQLDALQVQLAEQQAQNQTLLSQRAQLSNQLAEQQAEIIDLRQVAERIDTARSQAAVAEETLSSLNQQLAAKDAALNDREAEIEQLKAELADDTSNNEQLSALDAELAQLNAEREQLSIEQIAAQQALDNARNRIESLLTQNQQYAEQLNALQGELDAQKQARQNLADDLQSLSNEKASLVERYEDGRTMISIPTELLYGSGTAEISERGEQAIAAVAKTIKAFSGYTISVEGHSDSRPIGESLAIYYPSNWELSSARASAAVRMLIANGVDSERMRAIGHADNKPVASNRSRDGRAQNRRIEILLVPNVEAIIVTPNS